jgi:hypothetical protein
MSSGELTAMVMLRAASGKRAAGSTPITTQNLQEFLPGAEAAQSAVEAFQTAGFHVGTRVGSTFSITAPAETFEHFFRTDIDRKRSGEEQLPVPPELASVVESVTFEPGRELYR